MCILHTTHATVELPACPNIPPTTLSQLSPSAHCPPARRPQAQREACAAVVSALLRGVMPRLVGHALDPLSSVARSVVHEFARQVGCGLVAGRA